MVIRIPRQSASYSDLYELQNALIKLLMMRDAREITDYYETWAALEVLQSILVDPKHIKDIPV